MFGHHLLKLTIMKKKKELLCALFLSAITFMSLQSQETVSASGGNAFGSDGSVSYTLGQVADITINSDNGSVLQGVQLPFEILIITGIKEVSWMNLEYWIYPNPATDVVKLKIKDFNVENLCYQLYDLNGQLLQNGKIICNESIIPLGNLAPATYFLKVVHDESEVHPVKFGNTDAKTFYAIETFKIIKN